MHRPTRSTWVAALVVMVAMTGVVLAPNGVDRGPTAVDAADGFTPLFNGTNLDGWYTWIQSHGTNADPDGYFKVAPNGELRILDIPATGQVKPFGYLATTAEYSDYHLRLQYKWGTKKFAPRATEKRDSGLLYHVKGADVIWPTSVESQIQEGDTGDYIFLVGPQGESEFAPGTLTYQAGGVRGPTTSNYVQKSTTVDSLTDWNTVEVIVRGNSSVHIVNGVVVNRSFIFTLGGQRLTSGRILLQAEGAEISYRDVEIKSLALPPSPRVLAFTRTAGFRHDSIPAGVAALTELGAANGFTVEQTEDPAQFTDANLARFAAVVFLSTTGDVLGTGQQAAFEQYIRGGGGYVGVHAASDTEYTWPWYGRLVGAYFASHPPIQTASMRVENRSHPSTGHLGSNWTRTDEWYNFSSNPRSAVNVLLSLYEGTYTGGSMGDHPIAWYQQFDGGRSWYTGGGHDASAFSEPAFRSHLLGGVRYAAGLADAPTPPLGSLDRSGWSAIASPVGAGSSAALAIDGDRATRFTTGVAMTPGQYIQIDLGKAERFDRLTMEVVGELFDYPRGYAVYVSNNPSGFAAPMATGAGTSPITSVRFAPVTARYVRIVQTGTAPDRWWSVYDLRIYAPADPVASSVVAASVLAPARRLR